MMSNEEYEGWFGIADDIIQTSQTPQPPQTPQTPQIIQTENTVKGKEDKKKEDENEIKTIDMKGYLITKESMERNRGIYKTFLNAKTERQKEQTEILNELRNLMKDNKSNNKNSEKEKNNNTENKVDQSGVEISTISFDSNNKENVQIENTSDMGIGEIEDINYVVENTDKKLKQRKEKKKKQKQVVFKIKTKDGIVKFKGIRIKNHKSRKIDKLRHCIYLRIENDLKSENEKNEFKWSVKILKNTPFIGVGVADKNIVINNKFKFFSKSSDFYNGVFCLYSIYMRDKERHQIYPWHPIDTNINNSVVDFPPFEVGQEITMIYNSYYKTLVFISKNGTSNFTMQNVDTIQSIKKTTLTPCIIFYYPGDKVQISELEVQPLNNI